MQVFFMDLLVGIFIGILIGLLERVIHCYFSRMGNSDVNTQ